MRVIIAKSAMRDLEDIYRYLDKHYPNIRRQVAVQFASIFQRLSEWPKSGQTVRGRIGTRIVFVTRYPYKIYYRLRSEVVEIVHVHHTARSS
jgi:plasmid stabilization system protein ParE